MLLRARPIRRANPARGCATERYELEGRDRPEVCRLVPPQRADRVLLPALPLSASARPNGEGTDALGRALGRRAATSRLLPSQRPYSCPRCARRRGLPLAASAPCRDRPWQNWLPTSRRRHCGQLTAVKVAAPQNGLRRTKGAIHALLR